MRVGLGEKTHSKVTFAKKDFNDVMKGHTVEGADKASFEVLNDNYAKDQKSVYYKGYRILSRAPIVESFEAKPVLKKDATPRSLSSS